MRFDYTIFVDEYGTGSVNDIDLPKSATLLDAVDQAVAMSKEYRYHNAGIRVAAYRIGSDDATLVWANEEFFKRQRA